MCECVSVREGDTVGEGGNYQKTSMDVRKNVKEKMVIVKDFFPL